MTIRTSNSFSEKVDINSFLKCLSIVMIKNVGKIDIKRVMKNLGKSNIVTNLGGFEDKLYEFLWKYKQEDKIILDNELSGITARYPNYVKLCDKIIKMWKILTRNFNKIRYVIMK